MRSTAGITAFSSALAAGDGHVRRRDPEDRPVEIADGLRGHDDELGMHAIDEP
jgi:hypothetical protein